MILSTHNSFVANKLGLDGLILLNDGNPVRFTSLKPDTKQFFEKVAGYDTLRLVLTKKAILVEGDSDELIVQKAYLVKHGRLPIEDEIDVISVGTSFHRFLEIADHINQKVVVVTDNDGDVAALALLCQSERRLVWQEVSEVRGRRQSGHRGSQVLRTRAIAKRNVMNESAKWRSGLWVERTGFTLPSCERRPGSESF